MSRPGLWITFGGVALVAVGLGAWRLSSAPAPKAAAANDAELQAVKQELTDLKRIVRESRPTPVRIAENILPNTPPTPPSPAEAPPPTEPAIASGGEFEAVMKARQEESANKVRARRERIDRTLQAEPRDSSWANDATKTIQSWLVDPALAGANLKEVDCRTSMCRAHINLPEGKRVDDFILTTMDKMGTFQTTSLHILDQDGEKRDFVAYLGRKGQPLPQ